MNLYFDVLKESLLVSAPIPFTNNPTFFAMLGFGGYNMPLAAALAVLGSAIGAVLSYLAGYGLLKLYMKRNGQKSYTEEAHGRAFNCFSRYFIVLLPFSWLPLLNFLSLIAGFLGVNPRLTIGLVVVGQLVHYGYYLYV